MGNARFVRREEYQVTGLEVGHGYVAADAVLLVGAAGQADAYGRVDVARKARAVEARRRRAAEDVGHALILVGDAQELLGEAGVGRTRRAAVAAVSETAQGAAGQRFSRQGVKRRLADDAVYVEAVVSLEFADGLLRADAEDAVYVEVIALVGQGLLDDADGVVHRDQREHNVFLALAADSFFFDEMAADVFRHGRSHERFIGLCADDAVYVQSVPFLKGLDGFLRPRAVIAVDGDVAAVAD